jgi:hypothetical protein
MGLPSSVNAMCSGVPLQGTSEFVCYLFIAEGMEIIGEMVSASLTWPRLVDIRSNDRVSHWLLIGQTKRSSGHLWAVVGGRFC